MPMENDSKDLAYNDGKNNRVSGLKYLKFLFGFRKKIIKDKSEGGPAQSSLVEASRYDYNEVKPKMVIEIAAKEDHASKDMPSTRIDDFDFLDLTASLTHNSGLKGSDSKYNPRSR